MKKTNVVVKQANLDILKGTANALDKVEREYKGEHAPCVVFEDSEGVVYFVAKTKEEYLENINLLPPIFDVEKEKAILKKQLWSLLSKKIIGAKKQIIGKPDMANEELETLLNIYRKKYEDAVAGLDVFEAQSATAEITQEAFRAIVIQKGDEFKLAEKKINDLIESVRQTMEDKINNIQNKEDVEDIKAKLILADAFSILTPAVEIFEALND